MTKTLSRTATRVVELKPILVRATVNLRNRGIKTIEIPFQLSDEDRDWIESQTGGVDDDDFNAEMAAWGAVSDRALLNCEAWE